MSACARRSAAKIAADSVELHAIRHHRRDHEGGVRDLAEAKLLQKVILGTEHGGGRRAAVQQLIDTIRPGTRQMSA